MGARWPAVRWRTLFRLFRVSILPLVLACPLAGAAAELSGRGDSLRLRLRLDQKPVVPSPFRLEIQRSEYRLRSAPVLESIARHGKGSAFSGMIDRHARARGLDPELVHAVVRAESAYRPDAVSAKGAIGLMQVMPATGRRFGVTDLDVPESNLKAGTAYLRHLLDLFDNVPLALAAYNAGEGAVMRSGNRIPPYRETQGYVQGILRDYGKVLADDALAPRVYVGGVRLSDDMSPYRLSDVAQP